MRNIKKLINRLPLLLISALLVAGCQDDPATIGLDILPSEDLFTGIDSVKYLSAQNFNPERIRSNDPSYGIIGSVNDPYSGFTAASFITEVGLSREIEKFKLNDDYMVDSLVLTFSYRRTWWFGNKDATHNIQVFKFNQPLSLDEAYYSDMEVEGLYDPEPIGERISSAWDGLPDSIWDETNYSHKWEIKLNEATTNAFFNLTEEELESEEAFKAVFPGIFVRTESQEDPLSDGNGSLITLNLLDQSSDLRLYYHYFKRDTSDNVTDTIQTGYIFPINRECVRINRFEHDHQGAVNFNDPETDLLVAQGLAGSYVQFDLRKSQGGPIDFDLWEERLDPNNNSDEYYGISGVNLFFKADTSLQNTDTTFYSPIPDQLYIYTLSENGALEEPVYPTGNPAQPTQKWFEPAIYNPLTQQNQAYNPSTGEYHYRMVREYFELLINGTAVTPIDTVKIPQGPFYLASPNPSSDARRVILKNEPSAGEEGMTPRVEIKYVTFKKP